MRIGLDNYLEQVIDVNDREDLLSVVGTKVLYRYHRKSKKVYGFITEFALKAGKVYIKWDDGKCQWVCIQSVEVVI